MLGFDVILVGLISLVLYWIYQRWRSSIGLPPRPKGHFLWGNAKQLDPDNPQKQLGKWQKEYGDVYMISLGGLKVVVVSGEETIREVLLTKANDFSGRPQSVRQKGFDDFRDTVSFANDTPHWRDMKKALMTCLKMYGENLLNLEEIALETLKEFISAVKCHKGEAFDPERDIQNLVGEIMGQLVASKKVPDEFMTKLKEFEEEAALLFTPSGTGRELEVIPWLRYLGHPAWKIVKKWAAWQQKFYSSIIDDRKAHFDLAQPACLIDALYRHNSREKKPDGEPKIDEGDIHMMTRDAIGAGIITTFRATHSFIGLMTAYPEVQKKLQQEADEILGDREPRLADRSNMHYAEATILELLRYISHVPILLPHMSTKDSTIGGYKIPKGTQVWVNVCALHHDERYWDKPWTFMPERYLDEEGHLIPTDHPNRRRLLPFGAGRRVCVGEVLARNRIFLFFSSLMQNFNFTAAKGEEAPKHDPRDHIAGLVTRTPNYKVHAESRK